MASVTRLAVCTLSVLLSLNSACGGTTEPRQTEPALEGRRGHAMAYDEARHVTVLFGGWGVENGSAAGDRNSTWTWNGTLWTRVATTGPSARHDASMIYDASRQRVVLFGGRTGSFPNEAVLSDTWEWDGAAWSRRADVGPSARVHQTLTYDRGRRVAVLYGGFDIAAQQELHDIWEWNGVAWTKAAASASSSTVARASEYDEKANALYFLSVDNLTNRVVVDSWNGATLTRASVTSPSCPLIGATAGLGATRGGLMWVGYCDVNSTVVQGIFSGSAGWTQLSGLPFSARGSFAMAYDRDRDRVVLFGGESIPTGAPVFAETWEFDGTTWTKK